MRIAILTDVHANLTALRAVLDDIATHGPFHLVVSDGDQIFGGPRPLQTWNELLRRGVCMLRGNTERDLGCGQFPAAPVGGRRRDMIMAAFDWTLDQLSPEIRTAAASLPTELRIGVDGGDELLITHANAENLDDFIWADTSSLELERLIGSPAPGMLVVGHIHAPLDLEFNSTRIVRPGSVGLKYEAYWHDVAHWCDVDWDVNRRVWECQTHAVQWENQAEIEAGYETGYPAVEILPGFNRG